MHIIWRDNFSLDGDKLDKAIEDTLSIPECEVSGRYYSTYFIDDVNNQPEIVFEEEYTEVIHGFMKKMNLFKRVSFCFTHWMQLYSNIQSGHPIHDHFEWNSFFSWVHFVRPTEKSCFYFLDHDNKKVYPQQNPGDFIVFPPWALHGIDPCEEDGLRVTIAGNIGVSECCKLTGDLKLERIMRPDK